MSGRPFVATWRVMLMDAGLDPTAVAVGFILAEHADFETGQNARPSYDTVSKYLGGLSHESIRKAVVRLREKKLIAVARRPSPGKATVWRLTDPSWEAAAPSTPQATPQATPHVSVDLPRNQVTKGEEGDARASHLIDELSGLMTEVDPAKAHDAATSPVVAHAAGVAAEAGVTPERLVAAWREQRVNEIRSGPGLARCVLERAARGDQVVRPIHRRPARAGTRPRTPKDFGPSTHHLGGWEQLESA